MLPSNDHGWTVKENISHFPVTTANLHEADLISVIATLFTKLLKLGHFPRL